MAVAALRVALLVGSLRKDSLTRKVARALVALAPETLSCSIVEIGDLALYNEDLESEPPGPWQRFRSQMKERDAVLFLTPEYNRSVPACLKNAIDVGSRPQGQNVFDGVPGAIMSVTPYKLGAFGANHALRQSLVAVNVPVMQQPEAYIGGAADLFDDRGTLKSHETRALFREFMSAFVHWVERFKFAPGREPFSTFLRRRETIAAAYVSGDAGPLDTIVPVSGDASFFPPGGGVVHGAAEVTSRYDSDAKSFAPGGSSTLDVLQYGTEGNLAFWTGIQNAEAGMAGRDKPVIMQLRITELFRFQEGGWKLIHRHADPTTEKT